MTSIDRNKLLRLFSNGGLFHRRLPRFEERREQLAMAGDVIDAYNEGAIAFVEAGTGTGKSAAYLVPALVAAAKYQLRTVIATHTIALQQQLLEKEIPALQRLLGLELEVVLAQGMGNYLCLKRLEERCGSSEADVLPREEAGFEALKALSAIAFRESGEGARWDGSYTTVPVSLSSGEWEEVRAEHDSCNGARCPYYNDCFFFRARRCVQRAQVVVTNHALLIVDLAQRLAAEDAGSAGEGGILPAYAHLTVDEAHHLADVATAMLARRVAARDLYKLLQRIGNERHGLVASLRAQVASAQVGVEEWRRLSSSLAEVPLLLQNAGRAYMHLFDVLQAGGKELRMQEGRGRWRLQSADLMSSYWLEQLAPAVVTAVDITKRSVAALRAFSSSCRSLLADEEHATHPLCDELEQRANKLGDLLGALAELLIEEVGDDRVRWVEERLRGDCTIVEADLNAAKRLYPELLAPRSSVLLCSATLQAGGSFSFVRERLGFEKSCERTTHERVYPSPFNYERQMLFAIPEGLPPPDSEDFLSEAARWVEEAVGVSQGGALLLFTSFQMLNDLYEKLVEKLASAGFLLLRQGTMSRSRLVERFRTEKKAVLFGTDSFWEGIDVVGEALRLVIIMKLPFRAVGDPLSEAQSEALEREGRNPFWSLQLPQALLKFKQGLGRLIRHRQDCGAVLCLDGRVLVRPYGKQFLQTLPPCRRVLGATRQEFLRELRQQLSQKQKQERSS